MEDDLGRDGSALSLTSRMLDGLGLTRRASGNICLLSSMLRTGTLSLLSFSVGGS